MFKLLSPFAAATALLLALILGLSTACSAGADGETAVAPTEVPPTEVPPTEVPTATPVPPSPTPVPPTPTSTPVPTATATPTPTPAALLTQAPWDKLGPVNFVTFNDEAVELNPYIDVFAAPNRNRDVYLVHTTPSGEEIDYPIYATTFFENPTALLVVEGDPDDEYVRVLAPVRPVGTNVWIENDSLVWQQTDRSLHVFLDEAVLEFYIASELEASMPVHVGADDTPTPTGFAWVDEIIVPTSNGWGERIFSVAIFSEAIDLFGEAEGLAKVSLSGDAEQYWPPTSKGAIRATNADLALLIEQVDVGTPVNIWATRADFDAAP